MIHILSYSELSLRCKSHAFEYNFISQDGNVCIIGIIYAYNKSHFIVQFWMVYSGY
jgi:hypothetical protein